MAHKLIVVESDPAAIDAWSHQQYGLGVQLEALGQDGDQVEPEFISTAAEVLEVAADIKASEHLPARALIFNGTPGSDLTGNPINDLSFQTRIERPADYDERTDPSWTWRGDHQRPLSPYGRLLSSRLVQKAVPDVNFYVGDEEYDHSPKVRDLFHSRYGGGGYDMLVPTYSGFLQRVNRHAAASGKDFMSLVDGVGNHVREYGNDCQRDYRPHYPRTRREQVEGTDIEVYIGSPMEEVVAAPTNWEEHQIARVIGTAARLLVGEYPGITPADTELIVPRQEKVQAA